ncbi:hypothetical protein B0H21DRAFT_764570, partial [Amylocystis lapponica]
NSTRTHYTTRSSMKPVDSVSKVSEVFTEARPKYIHFVVFSPSADDYLILTRTCMSSASQRGQTGNRGDTPSSVAAQTSQLQDEQEERPIYNGRPAYLHGPSVALYNPCLARLKDALDSPSATIPTAQELKDTHQFFLESAQIYDTELERINATKSSLAKLLGVPSIDNTHPTATTTTGDGLVTAVPHVGGEPAAVICLEWKNELGSRGDAGIHVALTYRKHVVQKVYDGIRNASCCPCLLISIMGPYLCILGAVFVDQVVVQPPHLEMVLRRTIFHSTEAVADSISIESGPEPRTPRLSTTFVPALYMLKFQGWLPADHRKMLYIAIKDNTEPVVVKFTTCYCARAHHHLASHQLAPTLYFCGRVVGGHWMVVTALIKGKNAHNAFAGKKLGVDVLADVRRAISLLHDEGLVYGDLRRPNIMVVDRVVSNKSETEAESTPCTMLIDFDWAGEDGKARYPTTLNDLGDIDWAPGVERNGLVRKEHDNYMLGRLSVTVEARLGWPTDIW